MFTSHKTDALPNSSEHLVTSSLTGPNPSTSSIEHLDAQYLNDGTVRVMNYASKRSSVFNLRSRSNTAASSTSTLSLTSSYTADMNYADASRPGSPLTIHSPGSTTQFESGSRKSLFRGRRGKRLSGSISSAIQTTEPDEADVGTKRISVLRRGKKRSNQPETPCLKDRISSPFGFQHIAHTNRENVAAIQAHSSDRNFSSEALTAQDHRSPSALSFISLPQSPRKPSSLQQLAHTQEQAVEPTLRLTRSVESFSQSGLTLRPHRYSQSVIAPPRHSSLSPLAPIDDLREETPGREKAQVTAGTRSKRESGVWSTYPIPSPAAELHALEETSYFGHALTTPDDTAIQAMTPPPLFSPSLDDVAEEPERFVRPRPAPLPPMRSPTTPKSPHFDSSIFLAQRSPVSKRRLRGNSQVSPRTHNRRASVASQASDTLGSLEPVRRETIRRPQNSWRQSNTWRVPEESWEDDIDYAYEHAMEADCDFEWDAMVTEPRSAFASSSLYSRRQTNADLTQPAPALQPAFEPSTQQQERDFRASLLVPNLSNVPDLEPTSATSAYTIETTLRTPCDLPSRSAAGGMDGFCLTPSLLIPQEYKQDSQPSYEEVLGEYADSERHFTRLDPRHSGTSSARSRRSSYDSSLMSSAQSSGMWSSPIRRSASSAGSIPDLVPSRRSRREVAFSLAVDQLADSVASLSHLGEEKEHNDITPPGRDIGNKTFFSTEEEDVEGQGNGHNAVENEVRASLELARRGSQRSKQSSAFHGSSRHHKQAMSDGAAKLLATESSASAGPNTKPRSRAATTSQSVRSPMLSLFPAPPRNSPTFNSRV